MKINRLVVSQRTMLKELVKQLVCSYENKAIKSYFIDMTEEKRKIYSAFQQVDAGIPLANENFAWELLEKSCPGWKHKPMKSEYTHQLLVQRSDLCLGFINFSEFVSHQEVHRLEIKDLQVKSMKIALNLFGLTSATKSYKISPLILFEENLGKYGGFLSRWKEDWAFTTKQRVQMGTFKGDLIIHLAPSLFNEGCWAVAVRLATESLYMQSAIELALPAYFREIEKELGISVVSLAR